MIFRKPYAFLIKNFKKIHFVLLLFSLFVAYKLMDVNRFIRDFMHYGSYDLFQDPITNHITFFLKIFLILLILGSAALLFLLRHKQKPWKLYLYPIIEYLSLYLVLGMISSFFDNYTSDVATTDLRLSRDLLMIFLIAQLPAIFIFLMRIVGIDLKKFNFNLDEEFLELKDEDREEFEISINIDYHSFKRLFKRTFRNLKYFYLEHKNICHGILGLFLIFFAFQVYHFFFVTNKSYSEGNDYSINGYTIQVHNSYFTDKDYRGNVVTKNSDFVIIDLSVTNHSAMRKMYIDNFHLKNDSRDYVTTQTSYAKEFQDFGNPYESVKELKYGETFRFIIIFKVEKDLNLNKFNLFYQENDYLRKIKLKIKDYSKIKDVGTFKLGEDFEFTVKNKKQNISFDYYEFYDSIDYSVRSCGASTCSIQNLNYVAPQDKKILKIDFASTTYEGKDMVDFSNDYGKIVYIDNSEGENEEVELDFQYPFSKKATGKFIYTLVPREVETTSSLKIIYTIRNKKYVYQLV